MNQEQIEIPRRIQMQKWTPAEMAIYKAVESVEAMPADTRLTYAVCKLQDAKNLVADFVDNVSTEVYKYTESQVKELCWKLLENVINIDDLKEPLKGYKNDFEIWFNQNKK